MGRKWRRSEENRSRRGGKGIVIIVVVALFMGIAIISGIDFGGMLSSGPMSYDSAVEKLAKRVENVAWTAQHVQASGGQTVQKTSLEDSLPPIANIPWR